MTKTIDAPKGGISHIAPSIEEFKYAKNPIHTKAPNELNNALIKACLFINLIVYDKTLFDYPILLLVIDTIGIQTFIYTYL